MRLGADPEVFLVNRQGKLMSAIGLINAGKLNPMQIPGMPEGFTLQEDNVSLEYGIPPASSGEELYQNISKVMEKSLEYTKGLSFSNLSCAIFDADQMLSPAAHVFGCEPDFNAWTKDYNPGPQPPHEFMRSAGGHIHVETTHDPIQVVRAMDLFLGVPSVLMDKGEERRKLYGKAGAHRVKSYGVEYRTLSNFWIFDKALCEWVWRNTAEALNHTDWVDEFGEQINQAINGNDKKLAQELCNALSLEVL
jgi:hypothetical protein